MPSSKAMRPHEGHPRPSPTTFGQTNHRAPHETHRAGVFVCPLATGASQAIPTAAARRSHSAWDTGGTPPHTGHPWPRRMLFGRSSQRCPHVRHRAGVLAFPSVTGASHSMRTAAARWCHSSWLRLRGIFQTLAPETDGSGLTPARRQLGPHRCQLPQRSGDRSARTHSCVVRPRADSHPAAAHDRGLRRTEPAFALDHREGRFERERHLRSTLRAMRDDAERHTRVGVTDQHMLDPRPGHR